jgi:SPP1 gp7 family putative phage head morphogenesis protein
MPPRSPDEKAAKTRKSRPRASRRREPRAPKRKLRRKLPRAARFAKSIQPPDGAELRYRIALRQLVTQWWKKAGPQALARAKKIAKPDARTDAEDEAGESVDANLTDYSSTAEADWVAKRLSGVATDVGRHSDAQFKRLGIKLKDSAPGVAKYVPKWRKENVALTKTMFQSERRKLEQLLRDGANRRVESLSRDIEERFDITKRHADLIARSQTNRLNSQVSHGRMQSAGITTAIWTTAGDERVRESHDQMDGVEYELNDPPIVDDEAVLPGEPYNCRCVPFPVIPELAADDNNEGDDDV